MTSKAVFVHVFLPGERVPVPAGKLTVDRDGRRASGAFFYGRRYAEREGAFALDPTVLPLVPGIDYQQPPRDLADGGGLFLVFQDALPDAWGRRVIAATRDGRMPDDVELLLEANDSRTGALVFSAASGRTADAEHEERVTLDELAEATRALEYGFDVSERFKQLLRRGSSLGGARPKSQLERDGAMWLVKFQSKADQYDYPALEAATTELARRCGIHVPRTELVRVGRDRALLLERFDRPVIGEGSEARFGRTHYLSAATLVGLRYQSSAGSYIGIAERLRQRSVDARADLEELFRRVVFNVLTDNTDDHLKNHGLLHVRQDYYRLSPAFDVVMQLTNLGYQSLEVGKAGTESTIANALSAAASFGLDEAAARAIVGEVRAVVERWREVFREFGADAELERRAEATLTSRLRQAFA